jgi:hypothetical protein
MNFDYIEISRSLDKDKPCLDYLEWQYSSKYGWQKFHFEGCKEVEIMINNESNQMKIKGSIPYFIAGQNFKTNLDDLKSGIEYLSSILELNLYSAEVRAFEFGTILNIPFLPKCLFDSHIKITGMKARSLDYGKYFEDNILKIKLYDAGKNIKLKLDKAERESLSRSFGYDPLANYLKLENHYKKPSISFKKRLIQVTDLLDNSFQDLCKEDLYNKYNSIMKTSQVKITDKKQLSSSTLPLMILKEYEALLPCKAEELMKQKIKSIPSNILNREDKKSRVKQLKSNMKKIEVLNKCEFDLSTLLKSQMKESLTYES